MTKTLTKQWLDWELPNGLYYVKDWDGTINRFVAQNKILWRDSRNPIYVSERIEVLSPVPSYRKYNKLKKLPLKCFQLEEDNSALKVINRDMCKKIERLQKQIEIATKALKSFIPDDLTDGGFGEMYEDVIWASIKAIKEIEEVK